jgi:hypothetical protein
MANQPDCLNYIPKRFIQLEEAERRGLSWFFDGRACRYGHVAAHRTSNVHICSDCKRVQKGLEPIYATSRAQKFYEQKPKAEPGSDSAAPATTAAKSLGVTGADSRFLEHYARERDLVKAALAAGTTKELILARRVSFLGLDEAMSKLEASLDIPRYLPPGANFSWDDEKRELFLSTYINTGELDVARGAVGCTRAQYLKELTTNIVFGDRVEAAKRDAEGVIEEALIKAAKAGQQSILPKVAELLEKRAAARGQIASDPAGMRAEMTKMLVDLRTSRHRAFPAFRVRATGVLIERKDLDEVLRDTTTGLFYKRQELEEVPALVLNLSRNTEARKGDSPPPDDDDVAVDDQDDQDNSVSE